MSLLGQRTFLVRNGVKHGIDFGGCVDLDVDGSRSLQSVDAENVLQILQDELIVHLKIRLHLMAHNT